MKIGFYFFSVLLVLTSCGTPVEMPEEEEVAEQQEDKTIQVPTISDTSLIYSNGSFESSVLIKKPKTDFKGTILVLQGWNFPNTSWSDSSNLEQVASNAGFALVMPEMGKSIYHKRNYDQTRKDWLKYPTRTWLLDTVIYDLQSRYQLFVRDAKNFVMGLSTGGRGALIVAQENPEIFTAGCSLSGDYDQSAFPGDNLYRGYFGTNPEEWAEDENPVSFISDWSVPMYVAHGGADKIVSVRHQTRLEEAVQSAGISQEGWAFRVDDSAGHNYAFWSSEVETIIGYFEGFLD